MASSARFSSIGQSARTIAQAVQRGEVTATEVIRQHLAHIEATDGQVGAFVFTRPGEALAEAGRLDDRRDLDALPLAGVPVAIKDVTDVAGHPTRHGSLGTPEVNAEHDDETVARLRGAGAIVIGKTRCPELSIWGVSDSADGTARNPWNLERTPGGSSGGSAAAVSAAMVPIAMGSDGMGSVRIPAACTGIAGIKPGSGVVPMRFGDQDEHWSGMTQYGPLATNIGDLALMLDVLAGGRGLANAAEPDGALRIGLSTAAALLGTRVSKPWRNALADVGAVLASAGHRTTKQKIPASSADVMAMTTRWTSGASTDMAVLHVERGLVQKRTKGQARVGRAMARMHPVRREQAEVFQAKVDAMFDDIDVLILPTLLRCPPVAQGWQSRGWL
ncbi:MAG: amidase, partial [Glaciecola sp.]